MYKSQQHKCLTELLPAIGLYSIAGLFFWFFFGAAKKNNKKLQGNFS